MMSDEKSVVETFAWRLIDRFFPDMPERNSEPRNFVKYSASFFGTVTWGLMLYVYLLGRFAFANKSSSTEVFAAYQDPQWTIFVFLAIVVYSAMYAILIGTSVKRGTALNFYFWGLSIPVVVTNLLNFTFGGIG